MSGMTLSWPASGAPRGTAVLLHGLMAQATTWWRIGPALAGLGWETSAVDLPAVFVSAGRRGLEVELAPADLVRLTDAAVAAIAGLSGRPD